MLLGGMNSNRGELNKVDIQSAEGSSSSAAETGPLLRISGDASALCARLAAFRREGKLVDCIVRVEGSCDFPAHRNVLASSSDYMDALFASGMCDSDDTVITLDGISSHHCQALLDWMYEGTCNVCEGSLLPLLEQAAWLQMQSLQDSLASALKERLTAENVIGTWLAADRLVRRGRQRVGDDGQLDGGGSRMVNAVFPARASLGCR